MPFIHENFLLPGKVSRELYHAHAANMPIIDYHCHLSPEEVATNKSFADITELWLSGDHYKWRAMRANGIPEEYITGTRPSWEKFQKWAETVPYAMRNPLYHWTHLELSRVFGIDKLLCPATAREIFEECNAKLATPEFRGQALIRRFNVEVVCTTDDPADDLRYHRQIAEHPFGTKVLPTWRPDKAMDISKPEAYNAYLERLGAAAGKKIDSYADLIEALQVRHDFFAKAGCRLSDHGMETFYAQDYREVEIELIFKKVLLGKAPSLPEQDKFRSAFLHDMAVMDAREGWVQQFHVGPLRNCNAKMFQAVGPDTGFDAIGDMQIAAAGHKFFSRLALEDSLSKTILYCLNPKDFEVMAAMAGSFNDDSCPGKMQLGAGWWFLDQEFGMRRQMDALSSLGLLSRFVGMLTDSRSFISYTRHEYFRRILCDLVGADVESGRLPESEMDFLGKMVEDICYNNAKRYFNF